MRKFYNIKMDILAITSIILGSIVGAGFSTGQEVFYFFTRFNGNSFIYIFISCIIIYFVLKIFIQIDINNKFNKKIVKLYTLIFSFVSLSVMFSAFSQIGQEIFGINKIVFGLICFSISILIYLQGLTGIMSVNKIIMFFMIFLTISLAIFSINKVNISFKLDLNLIENMKWPIIYSSFNSIICLPIILRLRERYHKKTINISISIATCIIFLLIQLINASIFSNSLSIDKSMPLIEISKNTVYEKPLLICMSLEILTTILSNYIGIYYSSPSSKIGNYLLLTALFVGFFDFKDVLRNLYTIIGYMGVPLIIILSVQVLSNNIHNNNNQS
ncbi:hypothetical protein ACAG39_03065 [Caldicellulosiruptoraceae bacterium PP1]